MKKHIYILILFSFFFNYNIAQKVIQMEKSGGVYKIPCKLNGAKMKFIFDTGASTVSLSESIANYLFENDYLVKEDIIGTGNSLLADGSIVKNIRINIRKIEISGEIIKNVEAVIVKGQDVPLLLGQSVIQKLGQFSIDGDKLIINNWEENYSEEEIEKICKSLADHIQSNNREAVIHEYEKIKYYYNFSDVELSVIGQCYVLTNQYLKSIEFFTNWIDKYESTSELWLLSDNYNSLAFCYSQTNNYNLSIVYYQKDLVISKKLNDKEYITNIYNNLGENYYKLEKYYDAEKSYKKGIKNEFERLNINIDDIWNNTINSNILGWIFLNLFDNYGSFDNIKESKESLILSAKCGNNIAKEMCTEMKIDYHSYQKK